MSFNVKIDVNVDKAVKSLSDFRRHLRKKAHNELDSVLDKDVEDLKLRLLEILNVDIRTSSSVPNKEVEVPLALDIPKSKSDIVKEVFGADIKNSEIYKKGYTVDDGSNVFVVKNNRVKAWQSVYDSSTYSEQESKFKERVEKGIFIDSNTGKLYKVNPSTIDGLKLECSRDTGQTIDSEKKFDAYKNSPHVDRRKYEGPYNRTAVWTIKQEDVQYMMKEAIPLDGIIEKIQDGEYEIAKKVLEQYNINSSLDYAIENVENVKKEGPSTTDYSTYKTIREMINNLKIRKETSNIAGDSGEIRYVLFTSYDRADTTEEVDFFSSLKLQSQLWIATNGNKWFNVMVKAIEKAIHGSEGKFIG